MDGAGICDDNLIADASKSHEIEQGNVNTAVSVSIDPLPPFQQPSSELHKLRDINSNGFENSANSKAVNSVNITCRNLSRVSVREKRFQAQQLRQFRISHEETTIHKFYDADVFTFKPKVSRQSVRIAESLGTNFMTRQQKHLEKQKRYFEQAALQFKNPAAYGRLSPVYKKREKVKDITSSSLIQAALEKQDIICAARSRENTLPSMPGVDSQDDATTLADGHVTALSSRSSPSLNALRPHPPKSPRPKSSAQVNNEDSEGEDENNNSHDLDDSPTAGKNKPTGMSKSGGNLAHRRIINANAANVANMERFKNAKLNAEKCIKTRKVFTIQGPYPAIRQGLRERGWVEKFYKLHMAPPPKKSPRILKRGSKNNNAPPSDSDNDNDNDDDDDDDPVTDDDDDDEPNKVPPWEEEQGIYGIMSRTVRNVPPTFIWCVRRDAVDCKSLRKDQIINHYGKANFTTKVGLCMNLRNTIWFEPESNPDDFFPRCYRLSHDEEKQSFIEDYRLTMCINILKCIVESPYDPLSTCIEESADEDEASKADNTSSPPTNDQAATSPRKNQVRKKRGGTVEEWVIDRAIEQCEKFIEQTQHKDIDFTGERAVLTEAQWQDLLHNYYRVVFEDARIENSSSRVTEAEDILEQIKAVWAQYPLDGTKNIWIVKPGAKSRGRGIICYDRLEDMLKLVSSTVVKKDGKFVVQKYIERPLLIYNTKFDIRQWFLVTDWNPLTLWFYKDSYLRFCSQQFTLDDFNESIHLSNNAIQKNYHNGVRSSKLPTENMWSSDDFKNYLRNHGVENIWDNVIYPGMKKAVVCSILSTQDIVEYRKSAFELYGADFMLTEDYKPWLIEINSSPSMSYSTKVTAEMCANVLEDTIKVVVDRRQDKNADTGLFELAYKQPLVTVPPYIGINLGVEGNHIKRPSWMGPKPGELEKKTSFAPKPAPLPACATQETRASKDKQQDPPKDKAHHHLQQAQLQRENQHNQAQQGGKDISDQDNTAPVPRASMSTNNAGISHKSNLSKLTGGTSSAPPMLPARAPSPPKLQMTSINLHTPVETSLTAQPPAQQQNAPLQNIQSHNAPLQNIQKHSATTTSHSLHNASTHSQQNTGSATSHSRVPLLEKPQYHPIPPTSPLHRSSSGHAGKSSIPASTSLHAHPHQPQPPGGATYDSDPYGGMWGRTCKKCGSGANLKLDPAVAKESTCWCQQDSVKMDPAFGARQPSFPFTRIAPPLAQAYSLPTTLNASTAEQLGPVITAAGRIINLPKRFHVDKNKLMASVYAKTGTNGKPGSSERIVLRYTDGGIQKPDYNATTRTGSSGSIGSSQSFPKVISRYVSKTKSPQNNAKDGIYNHAAVHHPPNSKTEGLSGMTAMYNETPYKPSPKLSVVSQSFI